MSLEGVFVKCAADKLEQLLGRIESCAGRLTPEQIWMRGSEKQNAVGNLILHLSGNVRQWILYGVAGQPDRRERDLEFSERGEIRTEELLGRLRTTVQEALAVIRSLTAEQLLETTDVQTYHGIPKLQAVFHVVEHFSMHTGQIIFLTKWLTGEDLGFYKHLAGGPQTETVP